jgi:hypothetical protein
MDEAEKWCACGAESVGDENAEPAHGAE